jgi:hypothetical protein
MAARHPLFLTSLQPMFRNLFVVKKALPGFAHQAEVVQSMSQRSNCYDNAHAESCWSRLKTRTAR